MSKKKGYYIQLDVIPWPLFTGPLSADDVTYDAVQEFICHPEFPPFAAAESKQKVARSQLKFYHSDKFEQMVLPLFQKENEAERETAKQIAEAIARVLTDMKSEAA